MKRELKVEDVIYECSLVLNAALIGEPPSRVPECDPGKVGGDLLPGPVAGNLEPDSIG